MARPPAILCILLPQQDIEGARAKFPLVRFFCNGEISHNRLYGYTGVLTLFV